MNPLRPKQYRAAASIQKALATAFMAAGDPRFAHIAVNEVRLNRDASLARVYVSHWHSDKGEGENADMTHTLKALTSAAPWFQQHLASQVKMRHLPKLIFIADTLLEDAARMEALMAKTNAQDQDRI